MEGDRIRVALGGCMVTFVETFGPLLRIWIQRDANLSKVMQGKLTALKNILDSAVNIPRSMDHLKDGLICCARHEDGEFYRTLIVKPEESMTNAITVVFIDFGDTSVVGLGDLRLLRDNIPDWTYLTSVDPLARSYIVSGLDLSQSNQDQLIKVKSLLQYQMIDAIAVEDPKYPRIRLAEFIYAGKPFAEYVKDLGLGNVVSFTQTCEMVQKITASSANFSSKGKPSFSKVPPLDIPSNSGSSCQGSIKSPVENYQSDLSNRANYGKSKMTTGHNSKGKNAAVSDEVGMSALVADKLKVGSTHKAYVSFVDGPQHFMLQLQHQRDEILPRIDAEILKNISTLIAAPHLPGSTCLGRCKLDNSIRRCVLVKVDIPDCQVYYIDFGNTENVSSSQLFELPSSLRKIQPLALCFSLAEMGLMNITTKVKESFKKMVLEKTVTIQVTEPEESPMFQYCEVFLNGVNVKESLFNLCEPLEYALLEYAPERADSEVYVSFVDSPTQFYVQYSSHEAILNTIQSTLDEFCPRQPRLKKLSDLEIGLPVCSLFSDDHWYRAKIMDIDVDSVNVFYVDYGNRENVEVDSLVQSTRSLVKSWRTQAVECCLFGYETKTPDPTLSSLMEKLALGEKFTLYVHKAVPGHPLLIDLYDSNGCSLIQKIREMTEPRPRSHTEPKPYPAYDGRRPNSDNRLEKKIHRPYSEHDDRTEVGLGCEPDQKNPRYRDNRFERNDRYDTNFKNRDGKYDKNSTFSSGETNANFERKWGNSHDFEGDGNKEWRRPKSGMSSGSSEDNWSKNPRQTKQKFQKEETNWRTGGRQESTRDGGGDFKRYGRDERRGKPMGEESRYGKKSPDARDRPRTFETRSPRKSFNDERPKERDFGGAGDYKKPSSRLADDVPLRNVTVPKVVRSPSLLESDEVWGDTHLASANPPPVPVVKEIPFYTFKPDSEFLVVLSHMSTPDCFYVQSCGGKEELDKLQELINSDPQITSRRVHSHSLCVGTPVIARFSDDELLYRGIVKQITDHTTVSVLFIDYGNSSAVSYSELFLPTEEMGKLQNQSVRCRLVDVRPKGGGWDPHFEGIIKHFEDEQILMRVENVRFVDGELVLAVVLTKPNGETVSQCLVQDHLAIQDGSLLPASVWHDGIPQVFPENVPLQPLPHKLKGEWEGNLELFVGQFLRAEVVSVEQDGVFCAALEACCLNILCSLSSEQRVAGLKPAKKIIIGVLEVLFDRLCVTLYSGEGVPMGVCDSYLKRLPPVIPAPVVESTFKGYVTHSEGTTVYIQNLEDSDPIAELLENIYESYKDSVQVHGLKWDAGNYCAVLSSDGNWYRGVIEDAKSFRVRFIDYGNTENVSEKQLRVLKPEFHGTEFALKAQVPVDLKDSNTVIMNHLDDVMEIKVVKDYDHSWFVNFWDSAGASFLSLVESKGIGSELPTSPFIEVNSVIGSDLTVGLEPEVIVCHIDSPSKFWVHLSDHSVAVDKVQSALLNTSSMKDIKNPQGVFAAEYPADGTWYRAVNSGVEKNSVRFIDYGNVDVVTSMKELPDDLLKPVTGYAIPMYLPIVPKGSKWAPESMTYFEGFIDTLTEVTVAMVLSVRFRIVVDLKIGSRSLTKELIEQGYAIADESALCGKKWDEAFPSSVKDVPKEEESKDKQAVRSKIVQNCDDKTTTEENIVNQIESGTITTDPTCTVIYSHTNNLSKIFVHKITDLPALDEMSGYMISGDIGEKLKNVSVGDICSVKNLEDACYYRSVVIATKPNIEVFLIDYGGTLVTNECLSLPPHLANAPPLSFGCSLLVPKSGFEWSEQAVAEFKALMAGFPRMELTVVGYVMDFPVVTLKLGGVDVADLLTKSCNAKGLSAFKEIAHSVGTTENASFRVTVTYVESVTKFYAQHLIDDTLDKLLVRMKSGHAFPKTEPKVGALIAVKFPDDELWYRARVLTVEPEISVEYVDYGNVSVITEYRRLPPDLASLSPLAFRCSLEEPKEGTVWCEDADDRFVEIAGGESPEFDMIIVKDDNPVIVQLFQGEQNIANELVEINKKLPTLEKIGITDQQYKTDTHNATISNQPYKTGAQNVTVPEQPNKTGVQNVIVSAEQYKKGDVRNVYITHCESFSSIFIQSEVDFPSLDCISQQLSSADKLEQISEISTIKNDELIAAKFPDDGLWYRAKVIKNGGELEVRFIDYGNRSIVTEYRRLPPNLQSKGLAVECFLELPDGSIWRDDALDRFSEVAADGANLVQVKVLSDGTPLGIEFSYNGVSVIDSLVLPKVKVKDQSDRGTTPQTSVAIKDLAVEQEVFVTHFESFSCFFVQANLDTDNIDDMFDAMKEGDNFPKGEGIKTEKVVAIKNPEDQFWYRAVILNLEPEIKARLVDYGNCSAALDVRELPEKIANIRPLATRCSLLPSEGFNWKENAADQFKEMAAGGDTMFLMSVVEDGDPKIVTLFFNGKNVIEELQTTEVLKEAPSLDGDLDKPNDGSGKDKLATSVSDLEPDKLPPPDVSNSDFEARSPVDKLVANNDDSMVSLDKTPDNDNLKSDKFSLSDDNEKPKELCTETSNVDFSSPEKEVSHKSTNDLKFSSPHSDTDESQERHISSDTSSSSDFGLCENDKVTCTSFFDFNDLYIRHKSMKSLLDSVLALISDIDSYPRLTLANKGDLVLALNSNDNSWHRAVVLSNDPSLKVRLIDSGLIIKVDETRKIGDKLAEIQPLAERCQLFKPDDVNSWGTWAVKKFKEIVESGSDIFIFKMIDSTSTPKTVDLFLQEVSMSAQMATIARAEEKVSYLNFVNPELLVGNLNDDDDERGCVSHYNSPDDFYIHELASLIPIRNIAKWLFENGDSLEVLNDAKVDDIVCVKEGELYFRGRVLKADPKWSVSLIDYGNKVDCSVVKKLPDDMRSIRPIALPCKLLKPKGIEEWSKSSIQKFISFVNEGNSAGDLKVRLHKPGKPMVVDLRRGTHSLHKCLNKLLMEELPSGVGRTNDVCETKNIGQEQVVRRASPTSREDKILSGAVSGECVLEH